MINITFKECCQECRNRKTETREDTIYALNEPIDIYTEIGCSHRKACKEYRESDKEE